MVAGVHVMSAEAATAAPTYTLRQLIAADMAEMAKAKGTPYPSIGGVVDVLSIPGMWAAILWRLGMAAYQRNLKPISRLIYFLNIVLFGAELHSGAIVGPGVVIPHPVGIAFASGVTLGARCRLMRFTGAGGSGNPKRPGHPTVGDDVWLLDAAKLFGPITIGDRSIIGTSAIVSEDVPPDMFLYGARRSDTMRPLAELGLEDHGGSLSTAAVTVAAEQAEQEAEPVLGARVAVNGARKGPGPLVTPRAGEG
jgi:serine O-acetyltransferase